MEEMCKLELEFTKEEYDALKLVAEREGVSVEGWLSLTLIELTKECQKNTPL
jgi:hypothetical protein